VAEGPTDPGAVVQPLKVTFAVTATYVGLPRRPVDHIDIDSLNQHGHSAPDTGHNEGHPRAPATLARGESCVVKEARCSPRLLAVDRTSDGDLGLEIDTVDGQGPR
jgi:hypothetical protein